MPKIESIKSIWKKEEKNRIKKEEEDELEEKIRKKKRRDKIIDIVLSILFLPYVWEFLIIDEDYASKMFLLFFTALPFLALRWFVIKVLDYFNK